MRDIENIYKKVSKLNIYTNYEKILYFTTMK